MSSLTWDAQFQYHMLQTLKYLINFPIKQEITPINFTLLYFFFKKNVSHSFTEIWSAKFGVSTFFPIFIRKTASWRFELWLGKISWVDQHLFLSQHTYQGQSQPRLLHQHWTKIVGHLRLGTSLQGSMWAPHCYADQTHHLLQTPIQILEKKMYYKIRVYYRNIKYNNRSYHILLRRVELGCIAKKSSSLVSLTPKPHNDFQWGIQTLETDRLQWCVYMLNLQIFKLN